MNDRQLKELCVLIYRYEQWNGDKDIAEKMLNMIEIVKKLPDDKLDLLIEKAVTIMERFLDIKIWGEE